MRRWYFQHAASFPPLSFSFSSFPPPPPFFIRWSNLTLMQVTMAHDGRSGTRPVVLGAKRLHRLPVSMSAGDSALCHQLTRLADWSAVAVCTLHSAWSEFSLSRSSFSCLSSLVFYFLFFFFWDLFFLHVLLLLLPIVFLSRWSGHCRRREMILFPPFNLFFPLPSFLVSLVLFLSALFGFSSIWGQKGWRLVGSRSSS